jgi:predicted nucleic acid-binding Zn ribbon protein
MARAKPAGPAGRPQPNLPARRPPVAHVADVLSELLTRRNFAAIQGGAALRHAWRAAVGDALAGCTCPGSLRGGRLEVLVASSTLVQELTFQKSQIIERLSAQMPGGTVKDLRFRVGPLPPAAPPDVVPRESSSTARTDARVTRQSQDGRHYA